jgi:TRAP-type uncharacterized transport system, fused permease components
MSIAANAQNNETPDTNEVISQEKVEQLIEEFENEAATRKLGGAWAWIAGIVAAALSIYALYWTQATITTQVYRATFLMLVLALTFFYFPLRKAARAKVPWYDVVLAVLGAASMIYLSLNFREALQRVTQPTPTELVMGAIMLLLVLEATRRTTGMALTLVAIFSILYALFGYIFPEPFDHRGISLQRLIGTNYLTLQGCLACHSMSPPPLSCCLPSMAQCWSTAAQGSSLSTGRSQRWANRRAAPVRGEP